MNRSRGRFVARRPSRLGVFKSRGGSLAAGRSFGPSPSVAAAKLPRDGGAASPRAGYWKLVGQTQAPA